MSSTGRSKLTSRPVTRSTTDRSAAAPKQAAPKQAAPKKAAPKQAAPKKAAPKKAAPKKAAPEKAEPAIKAPKYATIPKVERPPATRRTKRRPLSIAVRREVRRMLQRSEPMSHILLKFQSVGITKSDVYAIRAGKVKLDYTPRNDKGRQRGGKTRAEQAAANAPTDSGLTFDELMDDGVRSALEDLRLRPATDPIERAIALERLQRVRRHQLMLRITGHLKRADAMVIARIVRKYEPQATDEDIVVIYRECQALVEVELRES